MTSIQIPLGPDKTWKIQVATKPTPEDVERFVQVIKIVLGGAPEKRERRISAKSTRISLTWTAS